MKKFLALILALVMVFSLTGIAFADVGTDVTGNTGAHESEGHDVTVQVTGSVTHVYHVEIKWDALEFVYNNNNSTWNPLTHEYEDIPSVDGNGWNKNEASVTVINHSDLSVWVNISATDGTDVAGVTVGFAEVTDKELEAPSVGVFDEAKTMCTGTVTVSGVPQVLELDETVVSTIKVVIGNTDPATT